MHKKMKWLITVSLLMIVLLIAAGCGSSQTAAPVNTTDSGHNMAHSMPMEDPNIFVKDMQQSMTMITEQTRLNKLEDAKKTAAELVALQAKLAVHLTDSKQKEVLGQSVLAVQAEVEKPGPSQTAIEKQMEVVKKLLNEISGQMTNHKHQ